MPWTIQKEEPHVQALALQEPVAAYDGLQALFRRVEPSSCEGKSLPPLSLQETILVGMQNSMQLVMFVCRYVLGSRQSITCSLPPLLCGVAAI